MPYQATMLLRTLVVVLTTGFVACDSDKDTGAEARGAETPSESIAVSPGDPVELSARVDGPVVWRADAGLVVTADSETWYLAPVEDGKHSVTAARGNVDVYRLDVEINGIKPGRMTDVSFVGAGGVAGAYGGATFSARMTAEGYGEARFSDGIDEIISRVTGYHQGTVSWRGQVFSGRGELSDAQRVTFRELMESGLLPALTFTSLELACRPGAENVDPVVGAALLFPWQVILKYSTAYAAKVARHYAGMAACRYFAQVTALPDTDATRLSPSPGIMVLGSESPIPSTLMYFPLDGDGARRAPSPAASHR